MCSEIGQDVNDVTCVLLHHSFIKENFMQWEKSRSWKYGLPTESKPSRQRMSLWKTTEILLSLTIIEFAEVNGPLKIRELSLPEGIEASKSG
jgi:hypothetical protein